MEVPTPFDYKAQALLYVADHLPSPKRDEWAAAMTAEIVDLVRAAGGRALCLHTSTRRMLDTADALLMARLDGIRVLVQGDGTKRQLLAEFASDETSVLVATRSFWTGVDVPGRALSLVTIDRIPFNVPTDPIVQARKELAAESGRNPFETVDVVDATVALTQGVGRLIRSRDCTGVVALLDPRLADKTLGYQRKIVGEMPPMRRTLDRRLVVSRLNEIRDAS